MNTTAEYVLASIKLYFALKEMNDQYSSIHPSEALALIAKIEAEAVLGPVDDEPAEQEEN